MPDDATPGNVPFSDQLGPLPAPDLHEGITLRDGGKYAGTEDGYTAETVLRLLAAERERCAEAVRDVAEDYRSTKWGKASECIGDACIAAIRGAELHNKQTSQALSMMACHQSKSL